VDTTPNPVSATKRKRYVGSDPSARRYWLRECNSAPLRRYEAELERCRQYKALDADSCRREIAHRRDGRRTEPYYAQDSSGPYGTRHLTYRERIHSSPPDRLDANRAVARRYELRLEASRGGTRLPGLPTGRAPILEARPFGYNPKENQSLRPAPAFHYPATTGPSAIHHKAADVTVVIRRHRYGTEIERQGRK